ncbi:hypothetical protein [Kineosporia babensis]|uniref:Uncharacterized protein n=1 Tax=Kineosporia babensis TaxID=499548 RepID=A0A9X1NJZ0_9ACTN|nr:hypothetical protein [Kineosporia babensis]MCD5315179.1 hypothetical protein [Kineosporia babensis]
MHWGYKALTGVMVGSWMVAGYAVLSGLDGCAADEVVERHERALDLVVHQLPASQMDVASFDGCTESGGGPAASIALVGTEDPLPGLVRDHGWTQLERSEFEDPTALSEGYLQFEDAFVVISLFEPTVPEGSRALEVFVVKAP